MDESFDELRPLLFSIAYRMVGSVSEAEDVVQDAFVRYQRVDPTTIESPKAYLSTVVTRLAIDHLRSARVRRETYVGTWLPEPLLTDEGSVEAHAETADSLSMAFLVLLESLSPTERAVLLLRDVFGYGYGEIAATIGKNEENCRQIAVRARRSVEARKPRFEVSWRRREELAQRFFAAAQRGDARELLDMLAHDVVAYGDGGGKAPAFPQPVVGRERIVRLLRGLRERTPIAFTRSEPATINGQPGAIFRGADGRPAFVVVIDVADDLVQTIHAIANPDKLAHLS